MAKQGGITISGVRLSRGSPSSVRTLPVGQNLVVSAPDNVLTIVFSHHEPPEHVADVLSAIYELYNALAGDELQFIAPPELPQPIKSKP